MSSLFSLLLAIPIMVTSSAGQFVTREISTDQGVRRYKLYIPSSYNGSKPLPLVVMLHGCTQDPDDIARGTQLNVLAESKSVLVAYPEQPESANPRKCWNWFDAAHQKRDAGEPALIANITRQIMSDYKIDANRVYVGGVSAGAAMAVNVAFSYPEMFAAVGSHSGIPYGAATGIMQALPAMQGKGADEASLEASAKSAMGSRMRSIPAIIFQGKADAVVKAENAGLLARQFAAIQGRRISEDVAGVNGDRGESNGGYHYVRMVSGSGPQTVELWTVEELGHAWSGGSADGTFTDSRGPKATDEMLRFFLEHPMGAAAAK